MTSLAVSGVIEGFYGTPWTHAQRLDMIDFIADIGMNTYVYAPKDDPMLRRQWRTLYPEAELAALAELVDRARSRGVRLQFAVSPGLSMRYSLAEDAAALAAKLDQVAGLGIDSFAIFLDDIPWVLQHPADRERYAGLVEAQAAVVNPLAASLWARYPGAQVCVTPTQYWGHGDEQYIAALGILLDPAIDIYWTGREICSRELQQSDAEVFAAATGRPPLYWDNFPVNDVAMTSELHIGPYQGREAGLATTARGIVANAMPLAEASKIALCSVADFCADPEGFDPDASWLAAIERVAGPDDAPTVREFADAFRGSALCLDDAPLLGDALQRFAFDFEFADRAQALVVLRAYVERLLATGDAVDRIGNAALAAEIAPWSAQYRRGLSAVLAVIDLLPAEGTGTPPSLDGESRERMLTLLEGFRAARRRAFGDLVDMFLSDVAGEFERR